MKQFGRMVTAVTLATLVIALVHVPKTSASNILMAVPIGTRSHNNFFMPIAEHLVQRNHTVTYVAGYELSKKHPNITVIFVPGVQIYSNMQHLFTTDSRTAVNSMQEDMKTTCLKALAYKEVQKLKSEKFDLVIVHAAMTDCFLSFAYQLKVPSIYVNPNKVVGAYCPMAGTPAFPALLTSFFIDLEYPLTFTGRMISTLYDILLITVYDWIVVSSQDSECRAQQLCPEDMPSLRELRLNTSLFITNSIKTMETPTVPYTPTVINAGGIHCRPAKPLPENLQKWITASGEPGFIYFSLGSLVKPSEMPEEYKKVLVEVFGSLKQRILWKFDEETMEGLPPNVKISKWLPQQDILGHPKLRLFITHGGLFSTQEAIYHGVPVLGIPVSLDQHQNMRMVQYEGWGRKINWEDLSYDSLRNSILQTMDDPRLQAEVHRRSSVMRDQPVSPGDWTNYWIEYVLRYNGAVHLRSPAAKIPWYKLYNVDVWVLVLTVIVATFVLSSWISIKILKVVFRCCFRQRKNKKD